MSTCEGKGVADLAAGTNGSGRSTNGVDGIDLQILRLLVEDARISQREVARRVGMSPPAVADRIARLERLGVIRGYRAEIDREKLGYPLVVILGIVAVQGKEQREVVEALGGMAEVEDVQLVTGPKDLLVRLRLRDTAHLEEVLFERIWNLEGVDRTETYVVLGGMRPKAFDVALIEGLAARLEERGGGGRV